MTSDMTLLEKQIEACRRRLESALEDTNWLITPTVLAISKELDDLIAEYVHE